MVLYNGYAPPGHLTVSLRLPLSTTTTIDVELFLPQVRVSVLEHHPSVQTPSTMAAGRVIAQMLIMGGTYVARAFIQAYQQALVNSARTGASGAAGAAGAARALRGRLTTEQASEILGVNKDAGLKDIYHKYDRLFTSNDPAKGGSIYLQAKIHNAMYQLERDAVARGEEVRPPPGSSPSPESKAE